MLKKSAKKNVKHGAMLGAAAKKRRAAKAEARHCTFMGIPVADPAVRPRGTTVKKIREAVAAVRKSA
ncbi:MAG TPA: hypothetical protein VH519_02655 [Hyphomicrobiaceae bacterium]|jgi:hypothetical protein